MVRDPLQHAYACTLEIAIAALVQDVSRALDQPPVQVRIASPRDACRHVLVSGSSSSWRQAQDNPLFMGLPPGYPNRSRNTWSGLDHRDGSDLHRL